MGTMVYDVCRVWDLTRGTCERIMAGHAGRLNAVRLGAGGTTALTVSDDYTARVWDLPSGRCMHVLKGGCDVTSVSCSPLILTTLGSAKFS